MLMNYYPYFKYGLALNAAFLLTACTHHLPEPTLPFEPTNHVVEKTVVIPPPSTAMDYRLKAGNNPGLAKAYAQYIKTGKANTIETDEFVQFPYNTGSQPLVSASVFELTVISLQLGEQVISVSCGDPTRWSYSLVYSGANEIRQAHVMIKPTKPSISTDFFITTDKRAYLLKLLSTDNGHYVRDVRFWYPEEIQNKWAEQNKQKQQQLKHDTTIEQLPNIDIQHLNFNYAMTSTRPAPTWAPTRVLDDGTHTYIQFPPRVHADNLPALFVQRGHVKEMVNYRFKSPYFVVDKVFKEAVLIVGVGRRQERVTLIRKGHVS